MDHAAMGMSPAKPALLLPQVSSSLVINQKGTSLTPCLENLPVHFFRIPLNT